MSAARWRPPVSPLKEGDQLLVGLCAPEPALPPPWVHLEPLLARAESLDVFPLVFHRLRRSPRWLPGKISSRWEESFRANAARNLLLEGEQQRLLAALAAAGVPAVPLKGISLARKAYGDPALRAQLDIDLYLSPRHLSLAFDVLQAEGYRQSPMTRVPPERLAAAGDVYTSQREFVRSVGGLPVVVEIHWRILPGSAGDLEGAAQSHRLPTELDFLYLCLHASADRWGKWKTLTDLAHLLARQEWDWERIGSAARRLGMQRILLLTLLRVQQFFDTPIPPSVTARLEPARPRRLPRRALVDPFSRAAPLSPSETHRLRLRLLERARDRWAYQFRLLRPSAADLAAVRLPQGCSFLYWGVRWLRLAGLLGKLEGRDRAAPQGVTR